MFHAILCICNYWYVWARSKW